MKKPYTIYLDEDVQIEAKKRSIDLKLKFYEYMSAIIKHELETKHLTSEKDVKTMGDGGKLG